MTWLAPFLLFAPTLFDQSVVRILQRNFPSAQFLLIDIDSREIIGARWWDSDRPIPLGSLTKPFLLTQRDDKTSCSPQQCWLPQGHGRIDYIEAIAQSCNSYFLQKVTGKVRYLDPPPSPTPEILIGLGTQWPISPIIIARAYATLARDPEATTTRAAMRAAARRGTAKLLGIDALAKTGTAPCRHKHKAPTDGYIAVLYPPETPKYVLLVQVHGVSGATAAKTAGAMLIVLRDGK
ncbi:MAG TPA: hypothetical protein VEX68_26260 [Bryobacteraceae bacterium]|nr:hypothetical protein [Bryobacteraceae bacterium]